MRNILSRPYRGTGVVLAGAITAMIVAACSAGEQTSPTLRPTSAKWTGSEFPGYVRVCKAGGPAGTYTFNVSVVGGGSHYLNVGATSTLVFDGSTAVCNTVYTPILDDTWEDGERAAVTVTEVLPDGMTASSIDVYEISVNFPGFLYTLTGTSTVTVNAAPLERYKINYYNGEAPPPGGFGCTPGYWKQSQHFDSWAATGFSPGQTVGSVFANASLYGLGGYTLVQGLSFKGGSTLAGAAGNLLRAAIAAQLNANHPDVGAPMTAAAMVTAVNNALASGDRDTMLSLASELDDNNNLGCALN